MSQTVPGMETRIRVVYPKPEQEIYEDSTFLMGAVTASPSGAYLEVSLSSGDAKSGQPVTSQIPLSPHGFFAWKVPIHAGLNPVCLSVRQSSATPPLAQELFALHGTKPLEVLPALPLALHEESLLPASDVWLTENDALAVACSASIDAEVFLDIPGFLKHPLPIPPASTRQPFVDTREPVFAQLHWTRQKIPTAGYYQAEFPVRQLLQAAGLTHLQEERLNLPLVLQLRHADQVLKHPLPGCLSLLTQPRPAYIIQDRAVTRTAPENGARLTPQREGTQVWIDGLRQGWARARLSQEEAFYLPVDALSFVEQPGPSVAKNLMGLVSISCQSTGASSASVNLVFTQPGSQAIVHACPIQTEVIPSVEMNRLQVRLYGVCSRCDFIHYPPGDGVVRQVHWRPVAQDVLELWIDLHHPLAGYDYAWQDGQWQFTVKTLPRRLQDIRVLIDPGHGGSETGATGLNGLPEKELNLIVSEKLRNALLNIGFQVMLTRHNEEEVSLPVRGEQVLEHHADIVLSIHHNALPDGRDPLTVEGASCFYYQPFAKPLAEALLHGLTDNRGSRFDVPNYGLFYDSLYMTRIHQATAVLVEIGFFTNPWEFERLINPEFQQEAAQRLAAALRTYCLPKN